MKKIKKFVILLGILSAMAMPMLACSDGADVPQADQLPHIVHQNGQVTP